MNLKTRVIGPCATFARVGDNDTAALDPGLLVCRLLLFETYILDSHLLLEAPDLVAMFGAGGLGTLLRSGCLKVRCAGLTAAQWGQFYDHPGGPLPLRSYSIALVKTADLPGKPKYISECLKNVQRIPGIEKRERQALKRAFVDAIVPEPDGTGLEAVKATISDLGNSELIRHLLIRAAKDVSVDLPGEEGLSVRVHPIEKDDFRVETNLGGFVDGSEELEHKIVERAILAAADLNLRIEQMRTFTAISGVLGEDAPALGRKFDFIAREMAPQTQEKRFERVLELRGLPSVEPGTKIDAEALLKIRDSSECREFRQWLQEVDSLADDDVNERLGGLKTRIGNAFGGTVGKSMRFVATTGLGFIPVVGQVAGPIASALDMFVADNVLSKSGPAMFLSKYYPSIFKR